jgi:uncharacterized protein (DUF427 family)
VGLSWQQGLLSPGAIGRFLVPEPLPKRLLCAEPLRRRMRVHFGGTWIADSEDVLLLFEPGRYPMAYFPETDVSPDTLQRIKHNTRHPDLGLTSWYTEPFACTKGCAVTTTSVTHVLAWSYRDAYSQVSRISDLVSFEPDIVSVRLDGIQLRLEPGQTVIPHGPDRDLDVGEALRPANG